MSRYVSEVVNSLNQPSYSTDKQAQYAIVVGELFTIAVGTRASSSTATFPVHAWWGTT
jgi:hypothetical protein